MAQSPLKGSVGVAADEEVADCPVAKEGQPTPTLVLGPVVKHVAALAERGEVAGPIVRGVVVPVRRGEGHAR